jgi:SSS family solute:Na+ symporter
VINAQALAVFIAIFAAITILGFWAARWHTGDLNRLQEWGLAGRRFGTFISWFLLGADIQTAYVVMSAPALILATGASGFFIAPTQVVQFIIFFCSCPGSGQLPDTVDILRLLTLCVSVLAVVHSYH